MKFTHLHVHTEYSLLDGSSKLKELVKKTKELGMDSIAITDHGVMYGAIDFYRAAKEEGVKPIIGCEVYVAPGSRFDREVGSGDERYHHLVLLAENDEGYANLMKIVSKGFTEGFYYKPRVDYEVLERYHTGIIALSACLGGIIAMMLRRGLYEQAKEEALRLENIFGEGNFFLEMQDHGIEEQKTVNQGLMRLYKDTGIDLVATNDIHYTFDTDVQAHDILLCIQTGKKVSDDNRMRYEGGQYYLKSPEEMRTLFPYALEALENTYKIAKRCNVEIIFGEYKLPHFNVPEGLNADTYLRRLCEQGLKERYEEITDSLRERLDYELSTIIDMGFVEYFLIVGDFIAYAKQHGITVGPGRGSAAGSIVSYALGITGIDPLKYNLLFERFLNPERVSMPDIDIDFCFERRQEVIDYVIGKYGKDKVVQIVTFGTMKARGVIRDVGRVLDLPYAYVDSIAKMIPNELGITLEKALKMNRELYTLVESDEKAKFLMDMSLRLEGLPRHTSMHAAGVVISPKEVDEYVPLSCGADDTVTTQYTMVTLEELGLLKMDFLGLRTLTVIQDTVDDEFKIEEIDYNDKKVLELIASGNTEGIFQLESAGMKSFIKELKPESLEDIIAGISLYRPGPMDFIPKYIHGKENRGSITYDCPELEPILKPTYGCIVYQEQVMQIVRDLAGYSYGRSDLLRRAMSKKKSSVMEKERKSFVFGNKEEGVEGCIAHGISEQVANKIYDEMVDFAKYAFNKSHAAAYAVISYQTAYLKYYYPARFMAALLTSVMDSTTKISEYIFCCRQMGIDILPPDINEGGGRFTAVGQVIRYGLAAVKGVGKQVIEEIVAERTEAGVFHSVKDFCIRLSSKGVNKRAIENFIKAGALDSLPGTRKQKMHSYSGILDGVNQERKIMMAGQVTLFDFVPEGQKEEMEVSMPEVGEYDKEHILEFEKEVLGVYISGHPLEEYEEMIRKNVTRKTSDFLVGEEGSMPIVNDEERAVIGGLVVAKTIKTTKSNTLMAFVTIEDMFGTVEVIVFPKDFEKYRNLLEEDRKLFIKGRVNVEEDRPAKLICEKVIPFDEVPRELWIQYETKEEYLENEDCLFQTTEKFDGNDIIFIYLKKEKAKKQLPNSKMTCICKELLEELYDKNGKDNVKVIEKSIEKTL